jgi:hypothetical protein
MKTLILFFLLFFAQHASSKNVDTYGATTFLSLSKKITKYGSLNFYHYDVFSFEKKSLDNRDFDAGLIVANFQTSYTYQWLPTLNFTGGHIYQKSNPFSDHDQNEHRIFEQMLLVYKLPSFSTTHRLRFEERFINTDEGVDFRTRLRYQIGAKMPLRGLSVDPGEFYINTYNEFYFSTTGERNALFSDDWAFFGLGLTTKELGSFEVGPLVQWSRVNEDKDTRTHYTVQAGWVLKFE